MKKFDIQDRVILDEMVDSFTAEMHKNQDEAKLMGRRPIITREYWLRMSNFFITIVLRYYTHD